MIYCIIIIGIVVAEHFIKGYVEQHFEENADKEACGGRLLLTKYHNKGAFLEFGSRKRVFVKWISVCITLIATLMFLLTMGKAGKRLLKTGLALLLGGAFSNTYDRLKRGYVVDYFRFNVKWDGLRRVIFNISDFCIIIGAMLSALSAE